MKDIRFDKVPGEYVVSFKRRRSGRLINVRVAAHGICDASAKALSLMLEGGLEMGAKGWREYGISQGTLTLTKHVYFGAEGVFEEWREDSYDGDLNGRVVERRKLGRKEIKKFL